MNSHIASLAISQIYFFEEVCCLSLASSQRSFVNTFELEKFDVTINKIEQVKFF